jgi:hypothetical protein
VKKRIFTNMDTPARDSFGRFNLKLSTHYESIPTYANDKTLPKKSNTITQIGHPFVFFLL